MARVDVGLPIPLPSGGYLNEEYASQASPIDPSLIYSSPVQTGINDAIEARAMNPVMMWLASQGVDVAAEKTGVKDVLRDRAAGLLDLFGLGEAQAAETAPMPPVQAGFQPTTSVVAQDVTPMQRSAMNYVPDSAIPMEGRRLPDREQMLIRQDWEGPGRGLAQGDTLPDGTMPVNMDGEVISAAQRLRDLGAKSIPDAGMKAQEELKKLADPRTPDNTPKSGGFLDTLKGFFGDEERMATLAIAFNSMRLTPDAGLASAMQEKIKDIRSTKKTNRTADALLAKGLITADQAEMIRMGMDYKDVIASGKTSSMQTLEQRATAAGLEPGSEAYKQFMLTGGQPKGMQLRVLPDGTVEFAESGGLGGVKLNESQANSLMYSNRMLSSNEILERLETEGTDLGNALVENIPLAGNYFLSPEYRQYAQARRDFINAVLRKESGAVISPEEFANSTLQYFPQPGDDPVTIEQKRQNRLTAIKSMRQALPKAVTEQQEEPSKSKSASIPPAPQGVDQEEWQSLWPIMSPQEKSLFLGGK